MLHGQTNVPTEFALTSARGYEDIFNDVEVDVIFTAADGNEWKVPAFWAGGNVFRVRFAASEPGRYTWRSVCANEKDLGLHGQAGELEVAPYGGGHALYEHGRLRVPDSKRTLEHRDGAPFLWTADTWWMGLTKRLDWPDGFRRLALDRANKGFNVIQIVCGPLPDFCATTATWDPQQANEAGWPWEKDYVRINPAFYDLADLRISLLVEMGLMPCIVGMWGYYLPFMGVEKVRKHWRYLVARYGAYPVVWCLAGEARMPTYAYFSQPEKAEENETAQKEGWTEVAHYVRELDPYRNLITVHPGYPYASRDQIEDASPLDLEMLQTGHDGYYAMDRSVDILVKAMARELRMPVFIGEACYEGIMGGSQQEVQRFLFWAGITSGACGHTYGAQGIWNMSSREEAFRGTTGSWGEGFWQDVMHLPGSAQVGLGRRFFERYPWWLFRPREEPALSELDCKYAFATGIPGAVAVYYLPAVCVEPRLWGMRGGAVTIEKGATYAAYYFNPRTGAQTEATAVKPDADGRWIPAKIPSREDWVLILEDKEALAGI